MRIYAPLNSEPEPQLQEIEVATFFQLPSFQIIGLPGPEVAEAKERIRSAIEAIGVDFPRKKIVLNLSPAHVRKKGTGLDLSMALSILNLKKVDSELRIGAWGELGLDGVVKPAGQITRALFAAWKGNLSYLFVSSLEMDQAQVARAWILASKLLNTKPPQLISVLTLLESWEILKSLRASGNQKEEALNSSQMVNPNQVSDEIFLPQSIASEEFSLMSINPSLERILGVVSAGRHHLLVLGPRGTGKTHALEWLTALQPPGSPEVRLRQRLIAELDRSILNSARVDKGNGAPIRRVSAQVKPGALIGGVTSISIRPGEYSLAHGGVLIADELPEWHRDSRESLREPLERGQVTLTRTQGSIDLPAQFLLAANGNLCPCGGWPPHVPRPTEGILDSARNQSGYSRCRCTDAARQAYLSRLSGPILDRIDLAILFTRLPSSINKEAASSIRRLNSLRDHIQKVQKQMIRQWGGLPGLLPGEVLEKIVAQHRTLQDQIAKITVSSLRSRHKVLRIALTLSAWDEKSEPTEPHFLEALSYRAEKLLFFDEPS